MVSNDDFDGKATNLNCFYLHINFEQKYPKPAIVVIRGPWSNLKVFHFKVYFQKSIAPTTQLLTEPFTST